MKKFIFKYALIILVNLFAFLSVGHILDEIFNSRPKFIIIFLVLSIVSLTMISYFYIRKTLNVLNKIKNEKSSSK